MASEKIRMNVSFELDVDTLKACLVHHVREFCAEIRKDSQHVRCYSDKFRCMEDLLHREINSIEDMGGFGDFVNMFFRMDFESFLKHFPVDSYAAYLDFSYAEVEFCKDDPSTKKANDNAKGDDVS